MPRRSPQPLLRTDSRAVPDARPGPARPAPGPGRLRRARAVAAVAVTALAGLGAVPAATAAAPSAAAAPLAAPGTARAGAPDSFRIEDERITESSGLAASRTHPGVYWTHNDSEDGPYVYAVDSATGRTVATVTLAGIEPRDLEGISIGPGGTVHVGDIGDNMGGTWPEVWVYRFKEPEKLRDTTVTPTRFTVRYEDGPRDAESLMVHPKTGRLYLVSKHKEGGGLYEGPAEPSASGVNTFRRIADIGEWATDAAFSPDGTRLVVRGYFGGSAYRWQDGKPVKLDMNPGVPVQRQGESVTFTPDGRALMFGSEGLRSSVTKVELKGELLPESVAKADADAERDGGKPDGKGTADGDGKGADGESGAGVDRNLVIGGLALAAVAVLLAGARKAFRRG
ncbi:hypothetical protein [Streptomyces xinghaiensis]|uniref:hypothetical protein n=1 Tax=Streptomyces xinghaiensis TaxID=1038928 RepID=UPI001EDED6F4|nr:hypothetical protein [Streptomyces xinghaiensis]